MVSSFPKRRICLSSKLCRIARENFSRLLRPDVEGRSGLGSDLLRPVMGGGFPGSCVCVQAVALHRRLPPHLIESTLERRARKAQKCRRAEGLPFCSVRGTCVGEASCLTAKKGSRRSSRRKKKAPFELDRASWRGRCTHPRPRTQKSCPGGYLVAALARGGCCQRWTAP